MKTARPRHNLAKFHLEADNVADELAGSEADHGDSSDDTVLAEETAQDHVPLPDIGQIPGINQSAAAMMIRTDLDSSSIWCGTGLEVRLSQGREQWSSQSPTFTRLFTRLAATSAETYSE